MDGYEKKRFPDCKSKTHFTSSDVGKTKTKLKVKEEENDWNESIDSKLEMLYKMPEVPNEEVEQPILTSLLEATLVQGDEAIPW